jgi:hypothetical protein
MRSGSSRASLSLVLLLTFGLPASGCSFLLVRRPPDRDDRRGTFDCTSSYAFPDIDTGMAIGGAGLMAVSGAVPGVGRVEALGIGFLSAFVFAVSAVHGYRTVSACNKALDEYEPPAQVSPAEPGSKRAE